MPVVLLVIDGLRPDAIPLANCPNLKALIERGAYSMTAQSVMPSVTLPCHMSIFHSVPPARHGVTTNTFQPMARPIPGLFERAAQADLRCASFTNWEPLRDLGRPGSLHHAYFCNNARDFENGDRVVAEQAAAYIQQRQPDLTFVYFGSLDEYGHWVGWMSDAYLAHIEIVDGALGVVVDALAKNTAILLQSDHGGHERDHGTADPQDMTIPWIVAGPGIRPGHRIDSPVSLLDTTPTLARLLGITPHSDWEGRVVEEIFGHDSGVHTRKV